MIEMVKAPKFPVLVLATLLALPLAPLVLAGCKADPAAKPRSTAPKTPSAMRRADRTGPRRAARPRAIPVRWDARTPLRRLGPGEVWAFENGRRRVLKVAEAKREGFTVINLGDDWTPILFTEFQPGDAAPQPFPYRKRYLDMANDRTDRHGRKLRPGQHNYLELYGIPPTLTVLRKRFLDTGLRKCLAKVDRESLRHLPRNVSAWGFRYVRNRVRTLRDVVRRVKRKHRLRRDEDLPRVRGGKRLLRRLRRAETREKATRAAIAVMRCEGFLKRHRGRRARKPYPGDELYRALTHYERKHMILGRGVLTKRLAKVMAQTADESDADTYRRVVRERIIHAAGILEDGSARRLKKTWQDAQGRQHRLPNLVKQFTEAALYELGFTETDSIRRFLAGHPAGVLSTLKVALRLPARPEYYTKDMDLSVVIHRGDVYYDPPIDENGKKVAQYRSRLPHLVVWIKHRGQRIPLVRWRTTVGGWRDELKDGQVYLRYKPSKVGKRVWRDIVAAPVWIPPPTTPHKELVSGRKLKTDAMGPGPYSAYGLVAALHLWPQTRRGVVSYVDQGIRTHGSYNYRSIRAGFSHGCHRLYNHLAIRMFSFILKHRAHDRVGLEPYPYTNRFEYKGRTYKIQVENRGYVYRMRRPIPVTVTRGRILGKRAHPIKEYIPKPGVKYIVDGGVPEDADGGVPAASPNADGGVPASRPAARPVVPLDGHPDPHAGAHPRLRPARQPQSPPPPPGRP